jgi:disulfide bond formation protein DsbB
MSTSKLPDLSPARVPAPIFVAWGAALFAAAASVYFIEILGKPAAALCWFDRMLVLGLLLILTVGIFYKDYRARRYAVPFLILGIPSATYQQLVHWNIIHVAAATCSVSVVCTTKFFNLFGFITQATLCLSALVVIAICLALARPDKWRRR